MNQNEQYDLRDKTTDLTVVFAAGDGRVERRFRLRESSRGELDFFFDLNDQAERELVTSAKELGAEKPSVVETVKAVLHMAWVHLAPCVAWCLREPIDGLPAPSAQECGEALNERKCLGILKAQADLDGLEELKKRTQRLNQTALETQAALAAAGGPPIP